MAGAGRAVSNVLGRNINDMDNESFKDDVPRVPMRSGKRGMGMRQRLVV